MLESSSKRFCFASHLFSLHSKRAFLNVTQAQNLKVCSLIRYPDLFSRHDLSVEVERINVDEENLLATIPRNSQEAILSCLSLHWINDLPGK